MVWTRWMWNNAVPAVVFFIPAVVYVAYVSAFGVNVPFLDDWNQIGIFTSIYTHSLTFGMLWVQHNENRMFFPNVLVSLMGVLDHFNIKMEMYASAAFMICSAGIVAYGAKVTRSVLSWWGVTPIAISMLSLSQHGAILWGFTVGNYMVVFCLVSSVVLLLLPPRWFYFAVLLAIIGSFSSMQGLPIWIAGIPALVWGAREGVGERGRRLWIWCLACVTSIGVYLIGFHSSATEAPTITYALTHAGAVMESFIVLPGAILPLFVLGVARRLVVVDFAFGLCVYAGALFAVAQWYRRGRDHCGLLGVSLIVFGIMFDAMVAFGRIKFGVAEMTSSRYTTYNLLLVSGVYLGVVSYAVRGVRSSLIATGGVMVLIAMQALVSYPLGWEAGGVTYKERVAASDVLVNYKIATDKLISGQLFPAAQFVRSHALIMQSHSMSSFYGKSFRAYHSVGLVPTGFQPSLLPVPQVLTHLIHAHRSYRLAWTALSAVYQTSTDLRQAFPKRSPLFLSRFLGWCLSYGVHADPAHVYLAHYRGELARMDALISRSPA